MFLATLLFSLLSNGSFYEPFNSLPISNLLKPGLASVDRFNIIAADIGNTAGEFTLRPGDTVADGNRAEFSLHREEGAGSEAWYSYRLAIPREYAEAPNPSMFQIMGQWHDSPPPGVAWKDYESHPPVLCVKYDRSTLTVLYGLVDNRITLVSIPITKGKWVALKFHIRWSLKDDGFVKVFVNDQFAVSYQGRNMYNVSPNYFKFGLYRKDGFTTTNRVLYDDLKVWQ